MICFLAYPSYIYRSSLKCVMAHQSKSPPPHHNTQAHHFAIPSRPRASEWERERERELKKFSLPGLSCSPSLQTSQLSSIQPRLFYSYVSLQPAPASWGEFFSLSFITIRRAPAFEFDTCSPTQPPTRGRARERANRSAPAGSVGVGKKKKNSGQAQNINNKIKYKTM